MKEVYNKNFPIELTIYKKDKVDKVYHYCDITSLCDDIADNRTIGHIIYKPYWFKVVNMETGADITDVVIKEIETIRSEYGCN